MGITLYEDYVSQPCRAVAVFLKVANIPFEARHVDLVSRANRGDEYTAINPFQQVPAIDDDNFVLLESEAILKYLTTKPNVPKHWYPTAPRQRANVDEFISWHHLGLRGPCIALIREAILKQIFSGAPADPETVAKLKGELEVALGKVESFFLKDKAFVAGAEISIADLLCCEEINSVSFLLYDWQDTHPTLGAYLDRVAAKLNPVYDEYNQTVAAFGAKLRGTAQPEKKSDQKKEEVGTAQPEKKSDQEKEVGTAQPEKKSDQKKEEVQKAQPEVNGHREEGREPEPEPIREPETVAPTAIVNDKGNDETTVAANDKEEDEQEQSETPAEPTEHKTEDHKQEALNEVEHKEEQTTISTEQTYENVPVETPTEVPEKKTEQDDHKDTTPEDNAHDSQQMEPLYAEINTAPAKKEIKADDDTYTEVQSTTEAIYTEVENAVPKADSSEKKDEENTPEPIYSEVVKPDKSAANES